MMDASLYRDNLISLLTEETAALSQLQSILEQEFRNIKSEQIEALDQLSGARDACMASLLRIDSERQTLCRASGFSADKTGLMQLIQWCDPSGSIRARWQQSTAAIRNCRALNDRNGALVNNRLHRVAGMLNTLTPGASNSKTYSARGNAYQNPQAGRVCSFQV
jgi:flagellar biosynthesis protein FlgN